VLLLEKVIQLLKW